MMKDNYFGRPPHQSDQQVRGLHAALLVDFDNVTLGVRSDLQHQLNAITNSEMFRGKISVKRAYADWRRYPQYIVPLSEASIDLIFAPAFGANKKNATDIRLAIDALELVFVRPEIGTFILLSGDSDFSSLVLKLKEYGKYVIGIGIRESASELLVQNCDEYYSYSELTGLTLEGVGEELQRDPWELAVEAIVKMKQRGDVMRSDRLKQVMQEIDSHFTEKTVGYNRFSKFVVEAGKRGLVTLAKLENGQHQIDIGPDANVPPDLERKLREDQKRDAPAGEAGDRGRAKPLALSEAFSHLKAVLNRLHDEGADSFDANDVREALVLIAGDDPVFGRTRFARLLRQAHDAELVELAKTDGNGYLVRLNERHRVPGPPNQPRAAGDAGPEDGPSSEATGRAADNDDSPDPDGLLKRVSAVVHRAIRGEGEAPE